MENEKSINEYVVKLTGKANIPVPLEIGHGYEILSKGEITTVTESDNNDGTHNLYYKFVPITSEITDELGKLHIKTKDKRSNSKLIFDLHRKLWSDSKDDPRELQDSYDEFCKEIMFRAEELYKKSRERTEAVTPKPNYPENDLGETEF